MRDLLQAGAAFARTRWTTRQGLQREKFLQWQSRQVTRWLASSLPGVAFYGNNRPAQLQDLPIVDKALLMARFEQFNRGRITAEAGWRAFTEGCDIDGVSIGASTGTSGNRSLYAITRAERYRWLGTILAKTLPSILTRPERVAVLLPQSSSLYDAANRTRRIALAFFDLTRGTEQWQAELEAFAPTTIVAPPRVLRHLAEKSARLSPAKIYSGAETLDPMDRAVIEAYFNLSLGQIYMASEGLFATSCAHGKLHLAEDTTLFEFEPAGEGLVSPLITSFQRHYQIMARYRMNDLLRLSSAPCPCGSPLQAVDEVVGRMDDTFEFHHDGQVVLITPDILRNAVLDGAREITDFRIIRLGELQIELRLHPSLCETSARQAMAALAGAFSRRGLTPAITLIRDDMAYRTDRKLRRVENRFISKRADP